jgi:hypothetical protein
VLTWVGRSGFRPECLLTEPTHRPRVKPSLWKKGEPGACDYCQIPHNPHWPRDRLQLQPRVLCFGLFQDGDVGIGIFPERQEILVLGACFRGVALQGIGASQAQGR